MILPTKQFFRYSIPFMSKSHIIALFFRLHISTTFCCTFDKQLPQYRLRGIGAISGSDHFGGDEWQGAGSRSPDRLNNMSSCLLACGWSAWWFRLWLGDCGADGTRTQTQTQTKTETQTCSGAGGARSRGSFNETATFQWQPRSLSQIPQFGCSLLHVVIASACLQCLKLLLQLHQLHHLLRVMRKIKRQPIIVVCNARPNVQIEKL